MDQDDASRIDLQSKTSAGLAKSAKSPLGKTIAQLARLMVDARNAGVEIDLNKERAVLAVAADDGVQVDNAGYTTEGAAIAALRNQYPRKAG